MIQFMASFLLIVLIMENDGSHFSCSFIGKLLRDYNVVFIDRGSPETMFSLVERLDAIKMLIFQELISTILT